MIYLSAFSEWVRSTRRGKDLTLEEVAERAGVKQPVWSKWESGVAMPRRETVIKIADALREDRNNALLIAGYLPSKEHCGSDLSAIESLLKRLPPEHRSKAIDAMCRIGETFLMIA